MFFNRQALHLRPDPARVVVRPFKPATEPRDLNPTDKTRANHIVDRVMALDAASVAVVLSEVLENFIGRHRNLLETFEARADEMEAAFTGHTPFTLISAGSLARTSCTSIPSKRLRYSIRVSWPTPISRELRRGPAGSFSACARSVKDMSPL